MLMKIVPGVVIGIVKQVRAGEVILAFPWLDPSYRTDWVPISAPMSGRTRGMFFMPELEDEVLVACEHGDIDHPYVVGCLWNGMDQPPSNDIQLRLFHSVNGHEIAIYDPVVSGGDKGFIRLRDAHGNVVELANGQITIRGVGTINIQAPNVIINGRVVAPIGPPI
jgi:phage baseplate assembly protein gpV